MVRACVSGLDRECAVFGGARKARWTRGSGNAVGDEAHQAVLQELLLVHPRVDLVVERRGIDLVFKFGFGFGFGVDKR